MALTDGIVRSTAGGGLITAYPVRAFDITPSDVTVFEQPVAVMIDGGTGDVVVEPWEGTDGNPTVTYSSVPVGSFVPVMVRRVLATGTAATGLKGHY